MLPLAESFLFRVSGSSWRERMLKPPLLVSAASDSSEPAAAEGPVGEMPKGRQATGKPSPDTSCETSLGSHSDGKLLQHRGVSQRFRALVAKAEVL